MLKITQGETGAGTLRVEGRIVGPWVAELRAVCERLAGGQERVELNLSDVEFADREGIALLRVLEKRGVRMLGCSPFLEEQLRAASPEGYATDAPAA